MRPSCCRFLSTLLSLGVGLFSALTAAESAAAIHTLQNDTWSPGGYLNAMGAAYICFPDETYSAEFEAPADWYPFKVLKLQTAFIANPLDALTGNPGTPCARFRIAIWRGSGSANPGVVMWDSVTKYQKDWDIPGDGTLVEIDLQKDLPDVPVIDKTIGNGRVRIGLRAVAAKCSDGSGNGSYPGMGADGATPKATFNWGYGWAVGMSGCAGGKQGNPFWVTAEQFGIKGNFVMHLVVDGADDGSTPADASGSDAAADSGGFWDDSGGSGPDESGEDVALPVDSGPLPDSGAKSDSAKADAGPALGDGSGAGLVLTAVEPACIASNSVDTALTLTGAGFSPGMSVTIDGAAVEVISTTATKAKLLLAADTVKSGAFTVKVEAGGSKAVLIGEAGLRVGGCGVGAGGGGARSGCSAAPAGGPSGRAGVALLLALVALLRRAQADKSRASSTRCIPQEPKSPSRV